MRRGPRELNSCLLLYSSLSRLYLTLFARSLLRSRLRLRLRLRLELELLDRLLERSLLLLLERFFECSLLWLRRCRSVLQLRLFLMIRPNLSLSGLLDRDLDLVRRLLCSLRLPVCLLLSWALRFLTTAFSLTESDFSFLKQI